MIDLDTLTVLSKHIRRTGNSLLQYSAESYPWTRDVEGRASLAALRQMLRHEHRATASLVKSLLRQRVPPPHLDPFPMHFTNFNFLGVDRLLALLIEDQRQKAGELEADVKSVRDPEARTLVQHLLDVKRGNLDELIKMTERPSAAASEVA